MPTRQELEEQLEKLQATFDAQGGRGVDLAEEIDQLQREIERFRVEYLRTWLVETGNGTARTPKGLRAEKIRQILAQIDDWDMDTVMTYAQNRMEACLAECSDEELDAELETLKEPSEVSELEDAMRHVHSLGRINPR